jgi:GxxExxY protein
MRLPEGAKEIRGQDFTERKYPHKEITDKVIGCAIRVHRELHAGFVEEIYENALAHELAKQGLGVERQRMLPVVYDGIPVGEHRADLIVEGRVVVELKSVSGISDQHMAQLMSTMKAAGAKVGLLINFGEARLVDGVRRVIL